MTGRVDDHERTCNTKKLPYTTIHDRNEYKSHVERRIEPESDQDEPDDYHTRMEATRSSRTQSTPYPRNETY
jgi:hypothetical protein